MLTLLSHAIGVLLVVGACAHVFTTLSRIRFERNASRVEHDLRMQTLELSLARATSDRDRHIRSLEGSWSGTRKFRIARKAEEAKDICSFYLVPHDGKPLMPFLAGQFLTFLLRIPNQQKPLVRCYSLSDSPFEQGYYRVSIKKLGPPPKNPECPPGISSTHFHQNLHEGDIVDVKAPSGSFCLDLDQRRPIVLIAGGVGVTPMLSMLKAACTSGYGQEIWFFYGLRNGSEHAFREELERRESEHGNVKLRYCYSEPNADDRTRKAFHFEGFVSVDLLKQVLPSNNFVFYICGPPPMMSALSESLTAWGVPPRDIRTEAFGPASIKKPEAPPSGQSEKFTIRFERSGKTLLWTGANNLLELAEDNGIAVDSGCRAGSCGTCLTAIRSGSVEYAHPPDVAPEAGSCLACIAVPSSDLVLDA